MNREGDNAAALKGHGLRSATMAKLGLWRSSVESSPLACEAGKPSTASEPPSQFAYAVTCGHSRERLRPVGRPAFTLCSRERWQALNRQRASGAACVLGNDLRSQQGALASRGKACIHTVQHGALAGFHMQDSDGT